MPSLSAITSSPMLREFAQGAAQSAVQPVADFLAPTVEDPTSIGRYKIYTEKNRFLPPNTSRAIGGRATVLSFDATDATYNCQPNALDFPIDFLEQIEEASLTNALMEGATIVAEVAALTHEQNVINTALAATTSGALAKTWSGTSGSDPIDDIDSQILNVIKAARYGSLMGVGVLFGAGAWRLFKNAPNVRSRFVAATAVLITLCSWHSAATSATIVAPSISAFVSAASSICSRKSIGKSSALGWQL